MLIRALVVRAIPYLFSPLLLVSTMASAQTLPDMSKRATIASSEFGAHGVLNAPNASNVPSSTVSNLRDALNLAWERAVQTRVAQSHRAEAEASQKVADSWFAEPPSMGISEKTDRFNNNLGSREREIELALPLWLPGQRSARQTLAARQTAGSEAEVSAVQLAIAGDLRNAVWAYAIARAEHEIERERLTAATAIQADIAKREKLGELARTDLLLVSEKTLSARSAVAEARTKERQALERYRVLTGLNSLPAQIDETVVSDSGSRENRQHPQHPQHPRLRLALAELERARAEMQYTQEDRRNAPELSVGLQQSRDIFNAPNRNSVRIGIRIPFGSEARNAPKVAAANTTLIRAEAELRQAKFEIDSEQNIALEALDNAGLAQDAAQSRAKLATERLQLQERAFKLGEQSLLEFMRVRTTVNQARLDAVRATYALALARAKLNQARGILP